VAAVKDSVSDIHDLSTFTYPYAYPYIHISMTNTYISKTYPHIHISNGYPSILDMSRMNGYMGIHMDISWISQFGYLFLDKCTPGDKKDIHVFMNPYI
jgi:hypothetical protein